MKQGAAVFSPPFQMSGWKLRTNDSGCAFGVSELQLVYCRSSVAELRFFNPYADIRFTVNRLPHWQQQAAVYFVTFRLADAVPHHLRTQWESEREAWLRVHPQPWSSEVEREYHERFSGAIERWLDAGHGSRLLRRHDCGGIMSEALRYFDGQRLLMVSSVVMPNHVLPYSATPDLAIGKVSPELEKLYLT